MTHQPTLFDAIVEHIDANIEAPVEETGVTPCPACNGTGIHPSGWHRYRWAFYICDVCKGARVAQDIGGNG